MYTMNEDVVSPEAKNDEPLVEAQVVEEAAKTEETAKVDPKKEKEALRFAELSKREQRLTKESARLKAAQAEIEAKQKEYDEFLNDPTGYWEKKGNGGLQDLLTKHLNKLDGKTETVDPKYKKLEDRIAAQEKQIKDKEEKEAQLQAQNEWRSHILSIDNFVNEENKKDPEKYELIIAYPNKALTTYSTILQEARSLSDHPLDAEEVKALIDRTEELLTNEYKVEQERLSKLKKFQPKTESDKTQVKPPTETTKKAAPPLTTLNSSLNEGSSNSGSAKTHEERIAEIKRKFG